MRRTYVDLVLSSAARKDGEVSHGKGPYVVHSGRLPDGVSLRVRRKVKCTAKPFGLKRCMSERAKAEKSSVLILSVLHRADTCHQKARGGHTVVGSALSALAEPRSLPAGRSRGSSPEYRSRVVFRLQTLFLANLKKHVSVLGNRPVVNCTRKLKNEQTIP